jgi:hypothetical protein
MHENRILVPRPHLTNNDLFFNISTIHGAKIYNQQNYLNWVEIPLNLAPGTYIYAIFSDEKTILESGKFVIVN